MNRAIRTESEEALATLVHDLRQPLGTLEYTVSYMRMLLGESTAAVSQQLRMMQHQIEVAVRLLNNAADLARPGIQRVAAESRDLTKSETAVVT